MKCEYFGACGSCTLYEMSYEEQLQYKINREKNRFSNFTKCDFDIIKSQEQNFRNRAEFRIWKNFTNANSQPTLSYAMNSFDKKPICIDECQIVSKDIKQLMPKLLNEIQKDDELSFKIFACEFLNSLKSDMLVTLIYHRKLEDTWSIKAKKLEEKFGIKLIGRSKKQKVVLSNDYIDETLDIKNTKYNFQYKEGGFTQPNAKVNEKMIEWVLNSIKPSQNDLCELYCGGGNFTIPLSSRFRKVLATEISKTSIKSAKQNCKLNNTTNIDFIRMSAQEFVDACENKREFVRLKDIDLKSYNFSTIFVDPPRAGLDELTKSLVSSYNTIIYISCNPETLHEDLEFLIKTHKINKIALFDQFAYTKHIECGVVLTKF